MPISHEEVFPILAEALPEFTASHQDWVEDRLSYPFINDMVRFVCDRAFPEFDSVLKRFAALLEQLLSGGDERVRWLVKDALEGLWSSEVRALVASHFGPKTQELWELVCKS